MRSQTVQRDLEYYLDKTCTLSASQLKKIEHILYESSSTQHILSQFSDSTNLASLWNKRSLNLISYLQSLLNTSQLRSQALFDFITSVKTYINSRDYSISGKYIRVGWSELAIVKLSAEFKEFNTVLDDFAKKIKPAQSYFSRGVFTTFIKQLSFIKNPLTLFLIASTQNLLAQAQEIPSAGLVAYFPFNGNALDATGNGHDGIVYGASFAVVKDRFGIPFSAAYLPENAYIKGDPDVEVDSKEDFPTADRGISFWVQTRGLTNGRTLFAYGGGPDCHAGFKIAFNSANHPAGNYVVSTNCEEEELVYINPYVINMDWAHFVFSANGSGSSLYINRNRVQLSHVTLSNTEIVDKDFSIGTAPGSDGLVPVAVNSADNSQPIAIDDLRIYNHGLEQDNIDALYDEKPPEKFSTWEKYNLPYPLLATAAGIATPLLSFCIYRKRKYAADLREIEQRHTPDETTGLLARGHCHART